MQYERLPPVLASSFAFSLTGVHTVRSPERFCASPKPLVLGAQAFLGEFVNDYGAVPAALTLAVLPPVLLCLVFSRQLIRGITAGAVK